MANEQNLIPFNQRSESEHRRMASNGGKKSGETRRKKAALRETLNAMLTVEVENEDWTPFLESAGLDSTLESIITGAIIKKAMQGDVKAYTAIRDTLGQTKKSEKDLEEQDIRIEKEKNGVPEEKNNPYQDLTTEELKRLIDDE